MWEGPASGDEVSVPAQQSRRLDEEVPETLATEQSCQSCQHRSICRLERRSVDLASEDRHLVAQHDDFDSQVRISAADEADQLKYTAERPIEEREGHCRMLAAPCTSRQSAVHSRWATFSARTGCEGDRRNP